MDTLEKSDFPVTRRTMDLLDGWVMALASPLLPLQEVLVELHHIRGFRWEFREETERALLVGKAVRMVSGIRVALNLADMGYIAECGTILRTVSDFANEIFSICEGCIKGTPTTAQVRFVRQYFAPMAKTPDEYDAQERERWVTRDELLTAHCRMVAELKGDADYTRKKFRFLAYGYDKFVHGAYITATELYDGRTNKFMLRGHEAVEKKEEYKRATASKLHEVHTALVSMANVANMPALVQIICTNAMELYQSGELSSDGI